MAFQTLVVVEVDTNDADYMSRQTDITSNETKVLSMLRKLAPLIKEGRGEYGHNWPATDRDWWSETSESDANYGEGATEKVVRLYPEMDREELSMFQDLCPYPDGGFHSVESINILWVERRETLL